MEGSSRHHWSWDVLWLVLLGTLSSWWCVSAAGTLGATFDEPIYLARGLEGWRTGSYHGLLRLGTMPLPANVQTLPLYLAERWRGQEWDLDRDFGQLLPWFRAGNLVFWWLLLVYALLLGRQLAGPWAGRLAAAVVACEPNLLAHASLATTDIALTASLLALIHHFRAGREQPWGRRVGVPTLWLAATILAKASGIIFGPLCMLALELERLWRGRARGVPSAGTGSGLVARARQTAGTLGRGLRPYLRESLVIGTGAVALVFLYCGCDWKPLPSFISWAQKQPAGATRDAMVWLADHLCIFSNAGEGIIRQVKHNMKGHSTFLLGVQSRKAIWYYFPVLLAIKLPLLPLALLGGIAATRWRALRNSALLLAGMLLVMSLGCRVQIGLRLVFPLVVLLEVGLAAAFVAAARGASLPPAPPRRALLRSRLFLGGAVAAVCWLGTTSLLVWPHGLCYVNELWGRSGEAYRLVSDSNYDWGQGIPELAAWRDRRGSSLDVWYFGTDPRVDDLGLRHVPVHNLRIEGTNDLLKHLNGQYLAVSTTALYGTGLTEAHHRAAEYLRRCEPADRTTTFLIYELRALRAQLRGGPGELVSR